jgi:hypothetical protein
MGEIVKLSVLSKELRVNRLFLAAILVFTASFTTYAHADSNEESCAKQVSEIAKAVYTATSPMKWPVEAIANKVNSIKDKSGREFQNYVVSLRLTNGLRMAILPYQIAVTSAGCDLAEIKTLIAPQE